MNPRLSIGHVPFDLVTRDQALATLDTLLSAGRGGYVVTPNIDHIVMAQRRRDLRPLYRDAALSLMDGQPVAWMARMLGARQATRISGSDLLDPLMALAAARQHPVFLFGARAAVAAEAARRLTRRHPGLRIVGRDSRLWDVDDPTPPDDSPVVAAIRASGARVVVTALGAPKQEIWMARHAAAIAPAITIGLGASLDFAAGTVSRAPAWISNAGLEWLYRLAQEPGRLAYRYLVRDLQILPIFLRQLALRKD
jgi:N-acetylglucosaminyldiphosphoundecaprenol N-acetyl-beta-D-mannosaminyltransferase